MGVPAHDQRDYEFAQKFQIDIIPVIKGGNIKKEAYTGEGEYINSDLLEGINSKEQAIDKIIGYLEKINLGKRSVNYRIRDWIFARQRYWGEPIPIVYDSKGLPKPLDDKDLPLILPELDDYTPSKTGESPLKKKNEWINTVYRGEKVTRESSTMPGSAGSSWYFLRYIDPHNDNEIANKELLKHWMPVDLYIGGPEHAVGHLLYSRMWNKYLYEKGIAPTSEPFKKLVHQGMILGSNGIKMGKRYPEFSINPNDIIRDYGADTLRLYEMFMGPIEADKPWNDAGVEGAHKFINRIWNLYETFTITEEKNKNLESLYHQTVKKVTDDYEKLKFNTAISQLMVFVNAVYKEKEIPREYAEGFIKMISPITPFIAEEIWQKLGHKDSISYEKWPEYDEKYIQEDTKTIGVQINGKLRGEVEVSQDDTEKSVKEKIECLENIQKYLQDKEIVKIIYIPNKIVSVIVK